jgi:RHS repeat-associated protein
LPRSREGDARSQRTARPAPYAYDGFGELTRVDLPGGSRIDYVLDAAGRRVGKKVDGQLTQGFVYGSSVNPLAELDASGSVRSVFVYGADGTTASYMLRDGKTYRIFADERGSVRMVVDAATGDVAQRLMYDEFGNVTEDTNPGFQPFGYAGGLYDTQTKLTRFGARDYDAETGRFTTKDPLGFGGGDTNLYVYGVDDPINRTDPSGLFLGIDIDIDISIPSPTEFGEHVVGAVDGATFGLTNKIRDSLYDDGNIECSAAYQQSYGIGRATSTVVASAAASYVGGGLAAEALGSGLAGTIGGGISGGGVQSAISAAYGAHPGVKGTLMNIAISTASGGLASGLTRVGIDGIVAGSAPLNVRGLANAAIDQTVNNISSYLSGNSPYNGARGGR